MNFPEIDSAWDMLRLGDIDGGRKALQDFIDKHPPEERYPAVALLAFDTMRTPQDNKLFFRLRDRDGWDGCAAHRALNILSWEIMPASDTRARDWEYFKDGAQPEGPHEAYVIAMAELIAFDERVKVDFKAEPSSWVASQLAMGIACLLHGNAEESLEWFALAEDHPERVARQYRIARLKRGKVAARARMTALLGAGVALRDLGRYREAREKFDAYTKSAGSNKWVSELLLLDCDARLESKSPPGGKARDPDWEDGGTIGYEIRRCALMDGVSSGGFFGRLFG